MKTPWFLSHSAGSIPMTSETVSAYSCASLAYSPRETVNKFKLSTYSFDFVIQPAIMLATRLIATTAIPILAARFV